MRILAALAITLLLAGCQTTGGSAGLYRDLGEREGIARLMEGLLYRIADDERIAHHFRGVDVARLHQGLTVFVCQRAGGPCQYTGDNMALVHRDMHIDSAEFNALVEQLILEMEAQQVPIAAQNRLLARLAPLQGHIVNPR